MTDDVYTCPVQASRAGYRWHGPVTMDLVRLGVLERIARSLERLAVLHDPEELAKERARVARDKAENEYWEQEGKRIQEEKAVRIARIPDIDSHPMNSVPWSKFKWPRVESLRYMVVIGSERRAIPARVACLTADELRTDGYDDERIEKIRAILKQHGLTLWGEA